MGNSVNCQCLKFNDNLEIKTGIGIYKFKKIVHYFF